MSRRAWRIAGIAAAGLVVAVLLAAIVLRLVFESRLEAAEARFRSEAGPLELAVYAPPDVTDPMNIAAWLQAGAAAILVADEDRGLLAELDDRPSAEWSQEERQRAEALLAELEPALTLLHGAAELTESSFGLQYGAGPNMAIPNGIDLLRASSLLAVDARLALERGDLERARTSTRAVERVAAALGREPILLFVILENAVTHRHLLLLRHFLDSEPTAHVLSELAADLRHRETQRSPTSRALAFEGAGAYAAWGLGLSPVPSGLRMPWPLRFLEPLIAARTLETFVGLVETTESPGKVVHQRPYQAAVWPWEAYSMLLVPNVVDVLNKDRVTGSALELARLAIELRRTALAEGRYPDTLVSVGDRPPAPSALSGEMPVYERTDSGGVRLAYPEARRRWEEYDQVDTRRREEREELLSWELPPLGPRAPESVPKASPTP